MIEAVKSRSRKRLITLTVNGEEHEIAIRPNAMLVDVVRDQIGLTGTKSGCSSGSCGACTLLIDGRPMLACSTLAVECDGKAIRTVEDLADGERLSPIQEAFLDQGAVQCGFCTPGMLMSVTALIASNPKPSHQEIKKALEGNLCRCTGYNAIFNAVLQATGQDGIKPIMF
ncbi:MAG: (2Fe-2S)-binding protein [Rhodobacteraceae bacterium]|nr:(2Fe-2S)-binding protein [Paracoccaceae bacterium]